MTRGIAIGATSVGALLWFEHVGTMSIVVRMVTISAQNHIYLSRMWIFYVDFVVQRPSQSLSCFSGKRPSR
jgi:hypothetical protein